MNKEQAKELSLTINEALDLARKHHNTGLLNEAENLYQQILQSDPRQPEALHLLGVVTHQKGNSKPAIDLIKNSLAIKPDSALAYNNLGNIFFSIERQDEAVESYKMALIIDPNFIEAYRNLSKVLMSQEKFDEAATTCRRALSINPESAEIHSDLGDALNKLGKHYEAAEFYQRTLAITPNDFGTLINLGNLLVQLGSLDEAIDTYREAIAITPESAEAHSNLGDILQAKGSIDEAITAYHTAISINPTLPSTHNNIGNLFMQLGQNDQAIQSYRRAITLDANSAQSHTNLGNALQVAGAFDKALASYQRALTIDPYFLKAHSDVGILFFKLNKINEAIESFQKALSINPNFADTHLNLGVAFAAQGDLVRAITSFQKALTVNPKLKSAWNNLEHTGRALIFSKGWGSQKTDILLNNVGNAARATLDYRLFEYYFAQYTPHEAKECFKRAIATFPPNIDKEIEIIGGSSSSSEQPQLPDNIVALLHFGRSGTGLLHSLLDNHPEISTLPSIFLADFFNTDVWKKISNSGWWKLPERFADEFAVLFDANSSKPLLGGRGPFIGIREGMTTLGENRNETFLFDREKFCLKARRLMSNFKKIGPKLFFLIAHVSFERSDLIRKKIIFYHIHSPPFDAKLNFLRQYPKARLIMMVREPIQSCESWVQKPFQANDYSTVVHRIIKMLFDIDQVPFQTHESVGIRLEDLKMQPKATMQSICNWLGIDEVPSLYQMTSQGKKWWGDPSSPDYNENSAMSPFDKTCLKRPIGAVFSETDQFVLRTLFYPFNVAYGYLMPNPQQFERDLREIPLLFENLLDFEKVLSKRLKIDPDQFKRSGSYLFLRAGFIDRWKVLNKFKNYPGMLPPLSMPIRAKS